MSHTDQWAWGEVSRRLGESAVTDTNLFSVTATAAPAILDALALARGQQFLEVGSGRGDLLALAGSTGLDGIGLDLSAEMVQVARTMHPGVTVGVGDAQALPFADQEFWGVVCSFTLGFVSNQRLAVAEAARVLREGGNYAVTMWDMRMDGFLSRVDATVHRFGKGYRDVLFQMNPGSVYVMQLLTDVGFRDVRAVSLPLYIRCAQPDDLLKVLRTAGASRALVEAEDGPTRARIEDALVSSMCREGDIYVMPAPAILVLGHKAEPDSG